VVVRLLACALVVLRRGHLRGRHGRSSRPAVQGHGARLCTLPRQSTQRGHGL
jgi:hypothetical protein